MSNNRVVEIKDVPLSDLKAYKGNPRVGNIQAIAESLEVNKQYKPIVVNKKDNAILAGNHTWLAAKSLGWETISVAYVDVDDDSASKIVLADNRTNDLATYDTETLSSLLQSLDNPKGTGYNEQDVSLILDAVERSLTDTVSSLTSTNADLDVYVEGLSNPKLDSINLDYTEPEGAGFDSEISGLLAQETEDNQTQDGFDDNDKLAEMQGIFEINVDRYWLPTNNRWDIPELRRDMILDKFPQPLDTWAGRDATPDDGVTNWLWNYGLARPIGMPYDRAIISFFTYDDKFMNFLDHTAYMMAKVINAGIKTAVVPDFSFYFDVPKVLHLQGVYNAQWLARLFQEAGVKVIPRLQFDDETSMDIAMLGIPKGTKTLAICVQNFDPDVNRPHMNTREKVEGVIAKCIQIGLDAIQPESLLIYGGNPGHNLVKTRVKPQMPTIYLDNYAAKRRGVVFDKGGGKKGERSESATYDPFIPGSTYEFLEDKDE